ncbi:sensor histidine kinase [Flindersiella endophytica]
MEERVASSVPQPPPVPGEPADLDGAPRVPVPLAAGVLACLVIGCLAVTLAMVADARFSGGRLMAALVIAGLLLVLQATHCASKYRTYAGVAPTRMRWWTFPVQAVLTYVPFVAFGEAWLKVPGLLAGAALLVWSLPWSWIGYAVVVVAQAGLGWKFGLDLARLTEEVVVTAVTGLMFYGVVRLLGVAYVLQMTRRRLVKGSVADEQERFRRDLHDLLGHRLMAVALKSELARRMLSERDLHKADEQLTEVVEAVRQAQSDVRAVAYGYPSGSLDHELSQVRSTLEAAGVRSRVVQAEGLAIDQLPPILDAVLAAVLHEGVTNVLRHSFAQLCEIEIGRAGDDLLLTIVNDGVRDEPHRQAAGGAGIPGLIDRVAAVGGEFSAGLRNGERFRLAARIPLAGRRPEVRRGDPGDPAGDPI